MRALVVYESMYGNTHLVADKIAEGLGVAFDVTVVAAGDATDELVAESDLLVVGGPTHAHGMTSSRTRDSAVTEAANHDDLQVDPDAEGEGLRDWFRELRRGEGTAAAAFDTRIDAPSILTGRASRGISHRLRNHGFAEVLDPESFLVDKHNHLLDGESERAHAWGTSLARAVNRRVAP